MHFLYIVFLLETVFSFSFNNQEIYRNSSKASKAISVLKEKEREKHSNPPTSTSDYSHYYKTVPYAYAAYSDFNSEETDNDNDNDDDIEDNMNKLFQIESKIINSSSIYTFLPQFLSKEKLGIMAAIPPVVYLTHKCSILTYHHSSGGGGNKHSHTVSSHTHHHQSHRASKQNKINHFIECIFSHLFKYMFFKT